MCVISFANIRKPWFSHSDRVVDWASGSTVVGRGWVTSSDQLGLSGCDAVIQSWSI